MNGRVYEPLTAQFLSPDPYIVFPDNWVSYNRYLYGMGNPFKYTDPSGEIPQLAALVIMNLMYATWSGVQADFNVVIFGQALGKVS
jgi:hypothetical protein